MSKKPKKGFWKWLIDLLSKIKIGGKGPQKTEDGGPVNPPPKP